MSFFTASNQAGARHPRNFDPFQPYNEGIQRVSKKNSKQQGDKKFLRPLQCENQGNRSQDDQRQTLRVHSDASHARRRGSVRHWGDRKLMVYMRLGFSIHGGFR